MDELQILIADDSEFMRIDRRLQTDRDHTHPFVVPTLGIAVRDEAHSQNVRTCRE